MFPIDIEPMTHEFTSLLSSNKKLLFEIVNGRVRVHVRGCKKIDVRARVRVRDHDFSDIRVRVRVRGQRRTRLSVDTGGPDHRSLECIRSYQ